MRGVSFRHTLSLGSTKFFKRHEAVTILVIIVEKLNGSLRVDV